jgi:hypothetical protein
VVVFALVAFGAAGCSSKVPFSIDNPTSAAVQVTVDEKALTLAPHSGVDLKLAPGRHTLASALTGVVPFMVYAGYRGGVINPTLSTYVLYNEVYAVDEKAAKRFAPRQQTIELEGVEFTGTIQKREGLFLDRDWRYGPREALPETIVVSQGRDGNIHGKLFALDDFVAYYEADTGEEGRFETERRPAPPAKFVATPARVSSPSGPAEWDAILAPLRALAQRRLEVATAEEQAALQKEYVKVMMSVTQAAGATYSSLKVNEVKRRQQEFSELMMLFAPSAMVLPQ